MTYTEIKEKGDKKYYYRVKSVREGEHVGKERVYLGANLSKEEVRKAEVEADKKLSGVVVEEKKVGEKKMEEKVGREEKGITIKKEQDPVEWYSQVCLKAGLADYGPVKGTMVIKPYGYALWQKIQDYFNKVLEKRKVENAYFPMFIPESFFKKEAEHAEGFSPEVAWLAQKDDKSERIALRPTSETIIYDSYSKWIRSWRDLPLRINQWCNIVRWEVSDCKLFLRSREFLWQEGHCVYATEKECDKEVILFLDEYEKLCKDLLAIPVLKGRKTEKEKFAGANYTTAIETFTPEGKALQCGTSHNLGQGFAKSFDISFLDKNEKKAFPWQTSWGFSTRLIGALVMMHSDNKGLVLPPSIAPIKVVIVPIWKKGDKNILKIARELQEKLGVELDDRVEYSPGYKFNKWELKGVPLRIELGPRDVKKNQIVLVRRDSGEKKIVKLADAEKEVEKILKDVQNSLYTNAQKFLDSSIKKVETWDDFMKAVKDKKMVLAPFCGGVKCEDWIKDKTRGVSSRVIPFEQPSVSGKKCVHCDKKAGVWAYFARAY